MSEKCRYKPVRTPKGGENKECDQPSETPYGYCKKHKSTVQGKKARDEMNNEASMHNESSSQISKVSTNEVDESVKKPLPKPKEPKEDKKVTPKTEKPIIRKKVIRQNPWGRFEDTDTGIVFDPKTKSAYGVQDHKTGKVTELKKVHIEICKRNKWAYQIEEEDDEVDESDDDEEVESEEDEVDEDDEVDESEEVGEKEDEVDEDDEVDESDNEDDEVDEDDEVEEEFTDDD